MLTKQSFLSPVLDDTFAQATPFHFLCLSDRVLYQKNLAWHPIRTPDRVIGTCFVHQPAPFLTIIIMLITWLTPLAPQLDYEFLRTLFYSVPSAWNDHPFQPLSPAGKLFQHLTSYVTSSRKMSLTFAVNVRHFVLFCPWHLCFTPLSWPSPHTSVIYLFWHIFLDRLRTY